MAIFHAIKNGQEEAVKYLLSLPEIDLEREDDGINPFVYAVIYDNESIVRAFIDYTNIDINRPMRGGGTLLTFACYNERLNTARVLLEQKSLNVNLSPGATNTPLNIAIANSNRMTEMLLSREDINVNETSIDGICPLAEAFYNGNLHIAELLLSRPEIILDVCDNKNNSIDYYARKRLYLEDRTLKMLHEARIARGLYSNYRYDDDY